MTGKSKMSTRERTLSTALSSIVKITLIKFSLFSLTIDISSSKFILCLESSKLAVACYITSKFNGSKLGVANYIGSKFAV